MFKVQRASESKNIEKAPSVSVSLANDKKGEAIAKQGKTNYDQAVIHAMPAQFFGEKKKPTNFKKILLIIGAVVVALIVIILGVLYYIGSRKSAPAPLPVEPQTNIPVAPSATVPENNPAPATTENTNINEQPAEVTPPTIVKLSSTLDSDNDGLTDKEEELFTTDLQKPDTDNDGYTDGQEVLNLYNPAGLAPVRIEDSGLVGKYDNPTYSYSILYPKKWLARALDDTNQEVIFTSDTGEFVQVVVQENPEQLVLLDWYRAQFPEQGESQIESVTNKTKDLSGIKSPDGLTVYYSSDKYIYAISYNIGARNDLNFKTIFEMMYASFSLATSVPAIAPTGGEVVPQ